MDPYPNARRDDTVDVYHGKHNVADPYRWLEDPDSEETQQWVNSENAVFDSYMKQHQAMKNELNERFTAIYNYEKWSCPTHRHGTYYYRKNDGLQNQSVLYRASSITDNAPTVFLDPNALAEDGTKSLGASAFSESGNYYAYCVQASGSDWNTVFVRDAKTGQDLDDKVEWVKFSGISWAHDDSGFFYSRYPAPVSIQDTQDEQARGKEVDANLYSKVYFHRIGTDQTEDLLVFENPDQPKWMSGAEVSDDGKTLIISVSPSTDPENHLYFANLENFESEIKSGSFKVTKAVENFDAAYNYVTNRGSKYLFLTNKNASRYRVVSMDITDPSTFAEPNELIPEREDAVLENVVAAGPDMLSLVYMKNVSNQVEFVSAEDGKHIQHLELPSVGSVAQIRARCDHHELFYMFSGFVDPGSIYRVDLKSPTLTSQCWKNVNVDGLDASDFTCKQVFYPSKDGTKIPMFIVTKKDFEYTADAPTFLYGYGGFNISLTPYFSPFRAEFVRRFNGVYALANLRGGGEMGDSWHKAGIKEKKQNVFDDFMAAAEYLVQEKYTRNDRIAINGGSNGGLLVGACITQRPDLFGCAVAQVGVMDMLRFHRFTIGYAWCADFGCADDDEDSFKYINKYSPLHNIRIPEQGQWPSTLLTTASHDDRVVPLHSFKFAAEMQHTIGASESQSNPLLIRVETKAGHGAGKPTSKIIAEAADIYTFIATALKVQ